MVWVVSHWYRGTGWEGFEVGRGASSVEVDMGERFLRLSAVLFWEGGVGPGSLVFGGAFVETVEFAREIHVPCF